jgi:hypothetical protein
MKDGSIRIDTRLESKEVETDLNMINQKVQTSFQKMKNYIGKIFNKSPFVNLMNDASDLSLSIDNASAEYQNLVDKLNTTNAKIDVQRQKLAGLKDELALLMQNPTPHNADSILSLNEKIAMTESTINRLATSSDKTAAEISKMDDALGKTANAGDGIKNTSKNVDNASKSISRGTSKLFRYALALFSIRSIYTALSGTVNAFLSSESSVGKQIRADIDYIKFAIGSAFAPLLQAIVGWLYQMLSAVNSISIALFKFDLFSNATFKNFKKATGAAKELKKQLAGWDEKNVLSSDKTASVDGPSPTVDLSTAVDPEKAKTNIEKVRTYFKDIDDYWNGLMLNTQGNWGMFIDGLMLSVAGVWNFVKGFFQFLFGFGEMLVGIFTGNFDLIQKGWNDFVDGIKNMLLGLVEFVAGILMSIVGFVKGIFLDIWDGITSLSNNINKAFSDFVNWFIQKAGSIGSAIGKVWNDMWTGFSNIWNKIKSTAKSIGTAIADAISGTIKGVVNALIGFAETTINGFIKAINIAIGIINAIPGINIKKLSLLEIPRLAKGGIVNSPTQALIGEAGREAVIPLQNNTGWMDEFAEKLVSKMNINSNGDIVVNVYLDGELIQRKFYQRNNKKSFERNEGVVFE